MSNKNDFSGRYREGTVRGLVRAQALKSQPSRLFDPRQQLPRPSMSFTKQVRAAGLCRDVILQYRIIGSADPRPSACPTPRLHMAAFELAPSTVPKRSMPGGTTLQQHCMNSTYSYEPCQHSCTTWTTVVFNVRMYVGLALILHSYCRCT